MFLLANEVGCTLFLMVDSELKDVAKANIVAPLNRVCHTRPLPDHLFKISLVRVFPGCAHLDPPNQPADVDSQFTLGDCLGGQ